MDKEDVFRHFSAIGGAPVDIEDHIIPFLRAGGLKDELYLFAVDINHEQLRGKLVHWEPWDYNNDWATDFDRPRLCATIWVAKSLDVRWQRVIACKELLHVLDPPDDRVSATEDIERLVGKIVLPLGSEPSPLDDPKTLADVMGLYEALAVLFPWRVREELISRYMARTLSLSQIAEYVDLPETLVAVVMSEHWPELHKVICPSNGKQQA